MILRASFIEETLGVKLRMQQRILFFTLAYALVLMGLSLRPVPENLDPGWPAMDKAIHAVLYALLSIMVAVSLEQTFGLRFDMRWAWAAFGITVAYGLIIELLQDHIPERSFDSWDAAANAGGAGVMLLFYLRCRKYACIPEGTIPSSDSIP